MHRSGITIARNIRVNGRKRYILLDYLKSPIVNSMKLNLPFKSNFRSFCKPNSTRESVTKQMNQYKESGKEKVRDAAEVGAIKVKDASRKGANRAKELFKKYGYIAVTFYIGTYVSTLAGLYVLVSRSFIPKGDIDKIFAYVGLEQNFQAAKTKLKSFFVSKGKDEASVDKLTENINNFATAWLLTKVTEPFRLLFTAAAVPFIVKFLKR